MFPYNDEENAWISNTQQFPKKYAVKIISQGKVLNDNSDLLSSLLFGLTMAFLSTAIPPLIYFLRLDLL